MSVWLPLRWYNKTDYVCTGTYHSTEDLNRLQQSLRIGFRKPVYFVFGEDGVLEAHYGTG